MAAMVLVAFVATGCCGDDEITASSGGGVWVCTGKGATVWHSRRDCGALKNCDGQVICTSSPGSQYKKACKRCH